MAFSPEQILTLPLAPDLLQAGIGYTRQAVVKGDLPPGPVDIESLRQLVGEKAAEVAFRRVLHQQNVPHELIPAQAFRWAGFHDAAVGGRRSVLVGQTVARQKLSRQIRARPGLLGESSALIPAAYKVSQQNTEDILIFAFITGTARRGLQALTAAAKQGRTLALCHLLPPAWATPAQWGSLGDLVLKSNSTTALEVTLCGLDQQRAYLQTAVQLPPKQRIHVPSDFYTLATLQSSQLPNNLLGVHSPILNEAHLVAAYDWGDLWLHEGQIHLAGYLSRTEFYRQAALFPTGKKVRYLSPLPIDHHGVPVTALRPLADLFTRAKNWARRG